MKRFEKIVFVVFVIISLVTILSNIFHYKGIYSLIFILLVLVFNFCFCMLFILIINRVRKFIKMDSLVFVICLIFAFSVLWYLVSGVFGIYYGSFITVNGFIFLFKTQKLLWAVTFVSIAAIIFVMGRVFFYAQKTGFERRKVGRIWYVFGLLILSIILIAFVPRGDIGQTNPNINFFKGLIRPGYLDYLNNTHLNESNEKILNLSFIGAGGKKPNVIVILLESISAEHVHYYGYERNITPNIDYLASSGIVFKRAYSQASHSNHAQPTFLSSRYTLINDYGNFFSKDYPRTFMWDILKKEGYNTAFISSQDENWMSVSDYYSKVNLDLYWTSLSDNRSDYEYDVGEMDFSVNTIKESIDWIDSLNNSDKPFFMNLNLQDTHYPYAYPENETLFLPDDNSILESFAYLPDDDLNESINRYDNSLHYIDKAVGLLLEHLREKNLMNDTIIVLTSDHGETFSKIHGAVRHGFGVYDAEIVVPLVIYVPGQEHREINENVRLIDVVPSVLEILNVSLSENFQGKPMTNNPLIFLYAQNQNFKIGLVRGDFKYVLDMTNYASEAYNLSLDPLEVNNLIKNSDDEEFYGKEYGVIVLNWFECQKDYYSRELWKEGIRINC